MFYSLGSCIALCKSTEHIYTIHSGEPTQDKCNGVVGKSSCSNKEVNEGEDLPVWGENLCCDCYTLESHHEKQCWSPSISGYKTRVKWLAHFHWIFCRHFWKFWTMHTRHRPVRHLAWDERPHQHTKVMDGGAQWNFVAIVTNQVPLKDKEANKRNHRWRAGESPSRSKMLIWFFWNLLDYCTAGSPDM